MKTACLTSISSKLFATPIISDTGLPLLTEHIFQTPPLFYLDPPRLFIFRLLAAPPPPPPRLLFGTGELLNRKHAFKIFSYSLVHRKLLTTY